MDFFALISSFEERAKGMNSQERFLLCKKMWIEEIPEPKEQINSVFLFYKKLIDCALNAGATGEAVDIASAAKKYTEGRADIGEYEFEVGRCLIEDNQIDKGKSLLAIANKKSRGRIFYGPYAKYKDFIK